jgi:hypothetical protein
MRKSVFVVAVIAAACSSPAFAGEVKQEKKATAPTVKAQTMSDAQMDKVTAGAGIGHAYAFGKESGPGWESNNGIGKALGHLK